MRLTEAEEYEPDDYYGSIEFERDEEHVIYLDLLAYVIEELDIVLYDGVYYNIDVDGDEEADFSLTAVYRDGEIQYWEQDGLVTTLHNYFQMTGEKVDLDLLECKIRTSYEE